MITIPTRSVRFVRGKCSPAHTGFILPLKTAECAALRGTTERAARTNAANHRLHECASPISTPAMYANAQTRR